MPPSSPAEPSVFYALGKDDFRAVLETSATFEEELRQALVPSAVGENLVASNSFEQEGTKITELRVDCYKKHEEA